VGYSLASQTSKGEKEQRKMLNYIFEGGTEGVIQVVFSNSGGSNIKKETLLAFAEGRKNGC